ncbi:helix-turn-helix domain-containing protein [Paenibacillus albicereus]|uniref:Helix-turn-helix domain-containing protein n=1 Tax=Paenibacillus albicereus TaxID=2726185 RepID=A0A6H2H1G7_9BACL|nr:helix-turn-helix domain-containing protein [Paenibacillus albicereus]QJC53497.1 helix-turn-helix domain-containing protein [Paenibacillus albicereus]
MKVLIVDDEVIIRTGLSTVLPWKERGFELLEPAASAEEALLRLPLERPDLILTDICMTGASGLELAAQALRDYPELDIIVLSGYDEFAYAQQAVREGVSEYLLKTSRPGEILEAADRARLRWQERKRRAQTSARESAAYREQLLSRLMLGSGEPDEELLRRAIAAYPQLSGVGRGRQLQLWRLAAAELPAPSADGALAPGRVEASVARAVAAARAAAAGERTPSPAEEPADAVALAASLGCPVVPDARAGWLAAAAVETPQQLQPLLRAGLRRLAERGRPAFAACGEAAADWSGLGRARQTAFHAFAFRHLAARSGLVCHDDVAGRTGMRPVCTPEEERGLIRLLQAGGEDELERGADALLELAQGDAQATPATMTAWLYSLLAAARRSLERSAASIGRELPPMPEGASPAELEERPREALIAELRLLSRRWAEQGRGGHSAVRQAAEYIRAHLGESLTLQQVARSLPMNPTYLSELFKRETGQTYLEFVTRERLERARELLLQTPAKVASIASEVGYEDAKYFNKLFKADTGLTPTEYRQLHER